MSYIGRILIQKSWKETNGPKICVRVKFWGLPGCEYADTCVYLFIFTRRCIYHWRILVQIVYRFSLFMHRSIIYYYIQHRWKLWLNIYKVWRRVAWQSHVQMFSISAWTTNNCKHSSVVWSFALLQDGQTFLHLSRWFRDLPGPVLFIRSS